MSRLTSSIRAHPLASYLALTYALSWGYWIPFVAAGRVVRLGGTTTQFPGLFAPMVAALAVTAVVDGRLGVRDLLHRMVRWRVPLRWWVVAVGSPLALVMIATLAMALGPGWPAAADFGRMAGLPHWGVAFVWVAFVLAAIGEETGWRGFAYSRLRRQHASNSVLLAAAWHGTYNVTSATAAAHGSVAAVVSTGVSVGAVALAVGYRKGLPGASAVAPDVPVASG